MMNVHIVLVSAFCLFFAFSASCELTGFSTSRVLSDWRGGRGASSLFFFSTFFFSEGSGGRVSRARDFVSRRGSGSCSDSASSTARDPKGAASCVRRTSLFVSTPSLTTSSTVSASCDGCTDDVATVLISSRGFMDSAGLSEGVSGAEDGVETAPALPFACARAAARAAFSCCLFSRRACAFAFFSALFESGTCSALYPRGSGVQA